MYARLKYVDKNVLRQNTLKFFFLNVIITSKIVNKYVILINYFFGHCVEILYSSLN